MQLLTIVLQLLASLSLLVMIHEFGHFLMAKLFGVRVEKFYLFFNPWKSLYKFKPKNSETTYGIGWLPLGGYVKLAGMIDESMDTDQMRKEPQEWEFRSKPAWQRLIIIIMGVVFNFLLALLIYTMIAFHYGDSYIPVQSVKTGMEFTELGKSVGFQDGDILLKADDKELKWLDDNAIRSILQADKVTVLRGGQEAVVDLPDDFMNQVLEKQSGVFSFRYPFVVEDVMPDSRAASAGLQKGDSLVSINDTLPGYVCTGLKAFAAHKNVPVALKVYRNGSIVDLEVTPDPDGRVGVYMKPLTAFYEMETITYGFFESIGVGVKKGFGKLFGYASDMKYVFTKAGAQSMGGFMSIGSLFPYPFNGYAFWEMTAFLSVILAFMNIMPIPALDGGHAMFILYEMITRKKPSEKVVMKAQIIGMMLLLFLMIYANMQDFFRFF